jgi:rhodanese-related sulfurtransferase
MRRPLLLMAMTAGLLLVACGSESNGLTGPAISPAELADRIDAGSPPFILDVRTPEEYASGHLPGATNIPHDELGSRIQELPVTKSEEIVVHCQSGRRAQLARATLLEGGYSNVRDLAGHWQAWRASGLPSE